MPWLSSLKDSPTLSRLLPRVLMLRRRQPWRMRSHRTSSSSGGKRTGNSSPTRERQSNAILMPYRQLGPMVGLVETLAEQASQLRSLEALQTGNAEVVQMAEAADAEVSPDIARNIAISVVFGLLLGVLVGVLVERSDRRIRRIDDAEEVLGLPVLSTVAESSALSADGANQLEPVNFTDQQSFLMLRNRLRFFDVDRTLRSVLITSPSQGDGKSTLATRLALVTAGLGVRTVLLNVDTHHDVTASRLWHRARTGPHQMLTGQASLEEVLQPVTPPERSGTTPDLEASMSLLLGRLRRMRQSCSKAKRWASCWPASRASTSW